MARRAAAAPHGWCRPVGGHAGAPETKGCARVTLSFCLVERRPSLFSGRRRQDALEAGRPRPPRPPGSIPCIFDSISALEKIAFSSNRDNPTLPPQLNDAEIYLMNPEGSGVQRLTHNSDLDGFATLNPDGSGKIVFDSNRRRAAGEANNTSDLFLMNVDGTEQTFLIRGGSPTWSPDGRRIAYHASSSGIGTPILTTPGAATADSDIFVANVAALLAGASPESPVVQNVTNDAAAIDDDPDWSPHGQKIAFTSHDVNGPHDNATTAEIYVINAYGTGLRVQLTANEEEERGPAWSPNGKSIAYACRKGTPASTRSTVPTFEICVMNADGTGETRLTSNNVPDLTPSWSADGQQIVFHRAVAAEGPQLFVMNKDGTGLKKLTGPPGINLIANWGQVDAMPPAIACYSADGAPPECTASDDG